MGEEIRNFFSADVTCISNDFFKKYLSKLNSDYLRVYLYIIWKKDEELTITKIADDLILTENDVEKALKFWKKEKLNLTYNIKEDSNQEDRISEKIIKEDLSNKKEFKELLFFAEKMLPNTISPKQKETFEYMVNDLRLPYEVIEFLIEYCCELDKTNSRYMLTVASDWAEKGIKTVKEIKKMQLDYEKQKLEKGNKSKKKNSNFSQREESYKNLEIAHSKNGTFGW